MMVSINPAEFRAALRARARAAAFHLSDARVSLIDVGWRIQEQAGQQLGDELTVRVHVRHKPRGAAFEAFAARTPERVIDKDQIGFPVDIVEADYRLQAHRFFSAQPPPRAGLYNPLRGGISISNEWDYNYGTLGGAVRDRETGAVMILSAWHVLAGYIYARPGLRIYQPGYGDGGQRRHTIARLTRHAMRLGLDAAIAELTDARPIINNQLGLGSVAGVTTPTLGMQVFKSGRTSGLTNGVIDGVEGLQTIPYGGFYRTVRHVVHIMQSPEGGEISRGGDSGAWWLEAGSNRAVGLHFAGDDQPEYGLATAMPQVLAALGVEIITAAEPVEPAGARVERLLEPVRG